MERELTPQRQSEPGSHTAPNGSDMEGIRENLEQILQAADDILDSLSADHAEEYLQQSRQRGAQ